MSKKILLTGGTGFIGRALLPVLLKNGYEVHSISSSCASSETEGVVCHKLNLLDLNEVKAFFKNNSFKNLIHLAWFVGDKCHVSNLNMDWTISTLLLLKEFHESGGKRFLCAGSVSEYEYKYGHLTEDLTPTDTNTIYGQAKNSIYNIAKVFCKQNAIDFKWARVFNLYGPYEKEKRLMPAVINACLKGEDVKVSDCLKFQDYLYVQDTANAISDIFESNLNGAVNICSGTPIRLRTIVEKIASLTNYNGKILWGAIPAAFGDDVVVGNNTKLKSIGWEQKYSLEDGLNLTINWWKNRK